MSTHTVVSSSLPDTQSGIDMTAVRNYLLGGIAAGGGVSLATALVNHFKSINDRAIKDKSSEDDDVLYVNVPHREKMATSPDALSSAVAMMAAPVGALGTYAIVQKLARKLKAQRLQQELDSAQNVYVKSLSGGDDEVEKAASGETTSTLSGWDHVKGFPLAVLMATALGSGVITNNLLNKHFPAPKTPHTGGPKRMVIREAPINGEDEENTEMEKSQSIHDEACECLLRNVLGLPDAAEASGLADLVKAASAGRTGEILAASDEGAEALEESIKNASAPSCQGRQDLAIGWLVRDEEISPYVKMAAAVEFAAAFPNFCQIAMNLPEDLQADLVKTAALSNAFLRAQRYSHLKPLPMIKGAMVRLPDSIRAKLEQSKEDDPTKELDVEGGETASVNEGDAQSNDNQSPNNPSTDPVDGFFQSPAKSSTPADLSSGLRV